MSVYFLESVFPPNTHYQGNEAKGGKSNGGLVFLISSRGFLGAGKCHRVEVAMAVV